MRQGDLYAQDPANHDASQNTKKLYNFIFHFKQDPDNCYIIGQNLGHKNDILQNYFDYITVLKEQTGRTPALIGGDIGLEGPIDINAITNLMAYHFNNGGMVTISWHGINPWTGTYYANPDQYRDFSRLINPLDTLHAIWMHELDSVAMILHKFKELGVPVLWRPFPDMNGNWYWWGAHPSRDPEQFISLWRHMFDYFTYDKGLDNLLWVFSVNQSTILNGESADWMQGRIFYPGDDYVDIVGITVFHDDLQVYDLHDYTDLKRFNKPLALTICGPDYHSADGTYDYFHFYKKLTEKFPEITYFNIMHNYPGATMALVDNQNYEKVFQQNCLVYQGEVDLNAQWITEGQEDDLKYLNLFPQPAQDIFFISSDRLIDGVVHADILDLAGRIVYQRDFENVFFLEFDNMDAVLRPGSYVVRLRTSKAYAVKKLIIQ